MCGHICKCYSVAAQFEECREKMIELPNIIRDLCHILFYGKVRIMVMLIWNWVFHQYNMNINVFVLSVSIIWYPLLSLRVSRKQPPWQSSVWAPSRWISSCRPICIMLACCGHCSLTSSTTITPWKKAACRQARKQISKRLQTIWPSSVW